MERDVRILIADGHEFVRNGLRTVIDARPGYKVVAEAARGEAALEMARQYSPDIAILDLTMHSSQQLISEFREAGARGSVLKSEVVQDLMAAIDTLLAGKSFFSRRENPGAEPAVPQPASGLPLASALMEVARQAIDSVPLGGKDLGRQRNFPTSVGNRRAVMDAGAGLEDIPEDRSRNLESLEVFSSSHGTRLRAFVPVRRN